MPKQLLHGPNVVTRLQQSRCERVSQRVRRHRFDDARTLRRCPDGALHGLRMKMVAANETHSFRPTP